MNNSVLRKFLIPALMLLAGCQQALSQSPAGFEPAPLPDTPVVFDTGLGMDVEVSVVASGLNHPWGFVQLPDGTMLVTERNKGQLRMISNGVLNPEPVSGLPEIRGAGFTGLLDIILHPQFAQNRLIYLTYNKPTGPESASMTVMRGTWNGSALIAAEDVFSADGLGGASRILFDSEGYLYMSIYGSSEDAQDLSELRGKVLRLHDDGSIPEDNPFVDTPSARAEIFTYGHRTPQGLALHPQTGEVWEMEMGPNGGDEVNILRAGGNYGWPYVSLGRDYSGEWQGVMQEEGYVDPVIYWMPSISVSGMTFYTGDDLEAWQGDLLVGGLRMGQLTGTGQMQRIRMNEEDEELSREVLFSQVRYRMRGAYQGVDGYMYVLLDEENGSVLRIRKAE